MIDLHQGFTGDELRAATPTVTSLAMAELDVAASLVRGRLKLAATQQFRAWGLLGRFAAAAIKERLVHR